MPAVKKSVSVKDVARLAGVSEQTVSRTVHDSPSVRPETKERVRAAMRELGYRPNFAGRSLRRGKFKTVGVAMFNITGTRQPRPYGGLCRRGRQTWLCHHPH